jgi:hypothetical protein
LVGLSTRSRCRKPHGQWSEEDDVASFGLLCPVAARPSRSRAISAPARL